MPGLVGHVLKRRRRGNARPVASLPYLGKKCFCCRLLCWETNPLAASLEFRLGSLRIPSKIIVCPLEILAKLPAPEREIVALHYIEDMPLVEIARALGIPEGTARWRLHKARERLRSLMVGGCCE